MKNCRLGKKIRPPFALVPLVILGTAFADPTYQTVYSFDSAVNAPLPNGLIVTSSATTPRAAR